MKLKNKKTGEIATVEGFGSAEGEIQMTYTIDNDETKLYLYCTPSLATFTEEWQDYEEPKEYWFIAELCAGLQKKQDTDNGEDRFNKQIGNYFETEEEAEKAVGKLKAWKRLKDKGFDFVGCFKDNTINYEFVERPLDYDEAEEAEQDLAFLFGGEE